MGLKYLSRLVPIIPTHFSLLNGANQRYIDNMCRSKFSLFLYAQRKRCCKRIAMHSHENFDQCLYIGCFVIIRDMDRMQRVDQYW